MSDIVAEAEALLEMGARMVDAGTVDRLVKRVRELEAALDAAAKREAELREALGNAVHAMRVWGSWEDGVPDSSDSSEVGDVGKAYDMAVLLLGWEEDWGNRKSLLVLGKERARIRELEAEVARLKTPEVVLAAAERLLREVDISSVRLHDTRNNVHGRTGVDVCQDIYEHGRIVDEVEPEAPTLAEAYAALRKGGG